MIRLVLFPPNTERERECASQSSYVSVWKSVENPLLFSLFPARIDFSNKFLRLITKKRAKIVHSTEVDESKNDRLQTYLLNKIKVWRTWKRPNFPFNRSQSSNFVKMASVSVCLSFVIGKVFDIFFFRSESVDYDELKTIWGKEMKHNRYVTSQVCVQAFWWCEHFARLFICLLAKTIALMKYEKKQKQMFTTNSKYSVPLNTCEVEQIGLRFVLLFSDCVGYVGHLFKNRYFRCVSQSRQMC